MADTSRAELFATQSLGSDPERIKTRLRATRVVIGIDPALAGTRLGQIGLVTATNILGRLGALLPNLYVDVPSGVEVLPGVPLLPTGRPLQRSLVALTRRLASLQAGVGDRCAATSARSYNCGLFVGRATAKASRAVTIGSNRWLATVRPDGGPESVDTSDPNPLGIILAAALGSAEIVKHMWLPIRSSAIVIEPVEQRVRVSAYDLSVDPDQPENPPMPDGCDLRHACVFGLGATGSGCMYVLGCLPSVRMSLDLVDMDLIEPSNIERLFSCSDPKTDVGRLKTDHAMDFVRLAQPKVKAFVYPTRFQQFVDADRNRLVYVWCCLDSATARRELQTELASVVVNGGTDASRWMLSSHECARPENACLRDLYPEPKSQAFDPSAELARLLGVGPEQIRQWGRHGRAIDVRVVDRAAARERDPARRRALLALKGKRFFQAVGHVCATMAPNQNAPAGTISFVALMPAIAMVSDLLKRRLYGWQPEDGCPNVFRFDALRSPARGRAMTIRASRRCLCQSENYRQAWAKRQKLRRSHLGRTFAKPAQIKKKTAPQPEPRRRPARPRVVHPQNGQQPRPDVQALARQLLARYDPAPQAMQPPVGAWDRAACRIGSTLLALMGICVHFAGLAAGLVLMGLFVAYESGPEGLWRPWLLIRNAWHTPLGFVPWLKFAGVSLAPLLLYRIAMPVSMLMFKGAHILEGHPIARAGIGLRRRDADMMIRFYGVTSLPVVGLGAVAFSAISLRCLRPALKALPCCAFAIIAFGVPLVLASLGIMIALPTGLADKMQKKLFPPVRK